MRRELRWQSWSILLIAAYFVLAPWILGFSGVAAAAWTSWLVGGLLVVTSVAMVGMQGGAGLAWLAVTFGVFAVAAPWLLGFTHATGAAWNAWLVGAATIVLAVWQTFAERPEGGIPKPTA